MYVMELKVMQLPDKSLVRILQVQTLIDTFSNLGLLSGMFGIKE